MADIETLPKLLLCPLLESYSVTLGDDVLTTQYETGMPRQRLGSIGRPHEVSVGFRHESVHQDYILAFWRLYRMKPFALRLVIEDTSLSWYECRFVGAPSKRKVGGDVYEFNANLLVKPKPLRDAEDNDLVWVYEQTDGDPLTYTNILERLVNESLPESAGSLDA